jgi:hypothetical protein
MSASPPAELAPRAAVTVEYAKSARSACKGCSAAIAKGALRLGAHARDPRAGYDTTKWYHVACFPASSHPLGPLDKLPGFLWIKVWGFLLLFHSLFPSVLLFQSFGLSFVAKLPGFWAVCRRASVTSCERLRR